MLVCSHQCSANAVAVMSAKLSIPASLSMSNSFTCAFSKAIASTSAFSSPVCTSSCSRFGWSAQRFFSNDSSSSSSSTLQASSNVAQSATASSSFSAPSEVALAQSPSALAGASSSPSDLISSANTKAQLSPPLFPNMPPVLIASTSSLNGSPGHSLILTPAETDAVHRVSAAVLGNSFRYVPHFAKHDSTSLGDRHRHRLERLFSQKPKGEMFQSWYFPLIDRQSLERATRRKEKLMEDLYVGRREKKINRWVKEHEKQVKDKEAKELELQKERRPELFTESYKKKIEEENMIKDILSGKNTTRTLGGRIEDVPPEVSGITPEKIAAVEAARAAGKAAAAPTPKKGKK